MLWKGADPMGLTIGSLPKLPDALVRNSWVKEVDVSNPGGARPDLPAGVKLEPSVRPGQVLDRVDWDSAVPLDPQFGENIAYRPDSPFLRNGRQDFTVFSGGDVSEAADFSMGKSVSVSVYYSPEAKRNQAWNRMSQERNTLIEQMKAEISAAGMDYFESRRFIKDSFTALYTDWMHNEPELFKVWFDWNEEDFANHAWDLTIKPEGWTDADFAFWKAYDPWGLEP